MLVNPRTAIPLETPVVIHAWRFVHPLINGTLRTRTIAIGLNVIRTPSTQEEAHPHQAHQRMVSHRVETITRSRGLSIASRAWRRSAATPYVQRRATVPSHVHTSTFGTSRRPRRQDQGTRSRPCRRPSVQARARPATSQILCGKEPGTWPLQGFFTSRLQVATHVLAILGW